MGIDRVNPGQSDSERLSQLDRLLYSHQYKDNRTFISKEASLANLERGDMNANQTAVLAGINLRHYGQFELADDIRTIYVNDLKATMSIDALFLKEGMRQKLEYTQTQNVHEYQHRPEKRGMFSRR